MQREHQEEVKLFRWKLDDQNTRLKIAENHVHLYLPYNLFCRTMNYLHVVLRQSGFLDLAKEYEDEQMRAFMFDILADDTATINIDKQGFLFGSREMDDLPGVYSQKQRIRKVREILSDEL
jgi:hypothetical protein